MLVLTAVPAETVRAVAVTGVSTGELLWASPAGQVARTARRKWGEATVDLPKARARPGRGVTSFAFCCAFAAALAPQGRTQCGPGLACRSHQPRGACMQDT